MLSLKPLHEKVVVERMDAETKSAGGILIPDTAIRALVFCNPLSPPCRWGWVPRLSDDGITEDGRASDVEDWPIVDNDFRRTA